MGDAQSMTWWQRIRATVEEAVDDKTADWIASSVLPVVKEIVKEQNHA